MSKKATTAKSIAKKLKSFIGTKCTVQGKKKK